MSKLDDLPVGVAKVLASFAYADILSRDPDAYLLGGALYQRPATVEGERAQREQALDDIHAQVEATPRPKEPVFITLCTLEGQRITYRLDSLQRRKKRTPSACERRRLLGLQLADFLTAGGL